MGNEILLSVCISVHNTAKYLPRCIESLLTQDDKSFEIVLVNNGSTDNSLSIMEHYRDSNPNRFVVVNQVDLGLAQGRQSGVNHASGSYVAFLDADDYFYPKWSECILPYLRGGAYDIIEFQSKNGDVVLTSGLHGESNGTDLLKLYFSGKGVPSMLWMRVYRRELFNHSIFPNVYTNNEDVFAFPSLLSFSKKVFCISKVLHCYSIDNDDAVMVSLRNKKANSKKYYETRKIAITSLDFVENNLIDDIQILERFKKFKSSYLIMFLLNRFEGIGLKKQLSDLTNVGNFSSEKSLLKFIRCVGTNNKFVSVLIKLIGVKMYCYLYRFVRRIIK